MYYSQPSLFEGLYTYFYSITFICNPELDSTGTFKVICGHEQHHKNIRHLKFAAQLSYSAHGGGSGQCEVHGKLWLWGQWEGV